MKNFVVFYCSCREMSFTCRIILPA